MDDLQLYWQSENAIEFLLSVGIPAFTALVIVGINLLAGKALAARVRRTAQQAEELVNEPDDRVVVALENVGEIVFRTDLDPKTISDILTAVTRGLAGSPLVEPKQEHAEPSQ